MSESRMWDGMWDRIIGLEIKAHQAWHGRGQTVEGRMILVDANLHKMAKFYSRAQAFLDEAK